MRQRVTASTSRASRALTLARSRRSVRVTSARALVNLLGAIAPGLLLQLRLAIEVDDACSQTVLDEQQIAPPRGPQAQGWLNLGWQARQFVDIGQALIIILPGQRLQIVEPAGAFLPETWCPPAR